MHLITYKSTFNFVGKTQQSRISREYGIDYNYMRPSAIMEFATFLNPAILAP